MRPRLLVLMFAIPACSKSGGEPLTKLDGKQTFDKLSAGDRTQLCTDLRRFGARYVDARRKQEHGCLVEAVTSTPSEGDDATLRAACTESYDRCMGEPTPELPVLDCSVLDELSCDITIDQFSACVRAQMEGVRAFAASKPCATITHGDYMERSLALVDQLNGGPACQVISDRCKKKSAPPAAPTPPAPPAPADHGG